MGAVALDNQVARSAAVLVVGDGDLSYSAAICGAYGGVTTVPAANLVATTVEAEDDLRRIYTCAGANIEALICAGARVLHGVDATLLPETLPPQLLTLAAGFSRVVFNFPHTLRGLKRQRGLLGRFFASAAPLLAPGGVVEVALCAGQGGSPADLERLRTWSDSWQAPLLAARAGLVLQSAVPWESPAGYSALREMGNKDGGGQKSFCIEGAVTHIFARRAAAIISTAGACAATPSSGCAQTGEAATRAAASLLSVRPAALLPTAGGSSGTCPGFACAPVAIASRVASKRRMRRLSSASAALEEALRGELCGSLVELKECSAPAPASSSHSPRYPAAIQLLQVRCLGKGLSEDALERAVRAAALPGGAAGGAWRWQWEGVEDGSSRHQLEVFVTRLTRTMCFAIGREACLPLGDWLVAATVIQQDGAEAGHAMELHVDLEVLAMLRCGLGDRRLLGESSVRCDGACACRDEQTLDDEGPLPLFPCAFVHDLRFHVGAAAPAAAALVVALREACGALLLEAFELDRSAAEAAGLCRWRLVLDSPGDVLDDRAAYVAYQQSREHVRQKLGVELC